MPIMLNNISGSNGLILIEKKVLLSDATTVTFSGLDGDTDEIYIIKGHIKLANSTASLILRPNGVSTGFDGSFHQVSSSTNTTGVTAAWTVLAGWNSTIGESNFDATFFAKSDMSRAGTATERYYNSTTIAATSRIDYFGRWTDGETNVTSIQIVSSSGNRMLTDSYITLYKTN